MERLLEHQSNHAKEKLYPCRYCQKSFLCAASCVTHESGQHPSRYTQSSLIRTVSPDIKTNGNANNCVSKNSNNKCSICYKTYSQPSSLQVHLKSHSKYRAFLCSFCDKGFYLLDHYVRHLRVHTKEKPYGKYIHVKV